MPNNLGRTIKEARKSRKLTQKEFASMIGAKHNSVSDWENGKSKPDVDMLERICIALDIPPSKIFEGEKEEKSPIPNYHLLDATDRETIDKMIEVLLSADKYKKKEKYNA